MGLQNISNFLVRLDDTYSEAITASGVGLKGDAASVKSANVLNY